MDLWREFRRRGGQHVYFYSSFMSNMFLKVLEFADETFNNLIVGIGQYVSCFKVSNAKYALSLRC